MREIFGVRGSAPLWIASRAGVPSWSFCVDVGGNHAGAVSGTMNMAGNVGSFCTALAFPYLKGWFDSTTPFFYIGAALNVVAIFMWLGMRPDQTLQSEISNT